MDGGGIGLMTLAVMTRATLGHAGQRLTAGRGKTLLHVLLLLPGAARVAAGIWPGQAGLLHAVSTPGWIGAFGGFAALNGGRLLRSRPGG
ncbi:NnrS family protein [Plastorhodobacter daqingensis]|uniref:NnrS family protein n=1 Tax=Plastorhodobacter daqingensis TaxID=1387281 RepID=A0ABW2UJ55_9RHOB